MSLVKFPFDWSSAWYDCAVRSNNDISREHVFEYSHLPIVDIYLGKMYQFHRWEVGAIVHKAP